jgi:hypothetical protein
MEGREIMLNQVAIVSETDKIKMDQLTLVSAAIQKQVSRDLAPAWNIDASVDSFESLEAVPLGYWPVVIKDEIPSEANGIHKNNQNGQPYALVRYSDDWPILTSHEVMEMLVDPSGSRMVAANSPYPDQGRVLVLVEVCDPTQGTQFGYSVNGVLLSDFYTPRFFDPVAAEGVAYSFSGCIKKPLQVLDDGYLSWWDPVSTHMFQLFVNGAKKRFEDRGPVPGGFDTLRSFADSFTNARRATRKRRLRSGLLLTSAIGPRKRKDGKIDASRKAQAAVLAREIERVCKRRTRS